MDKSVSLPLAVQHALAAAFRPLTGNLVYKTRAGISAGLKRKGGFGFLPRQLNEEEKFLLSLRPSLRGKTVYDVGAYEGVFSSFFAHAVGSDGTLVVFEPNPLCQELTKCNLNLNGFKFHIEPVGLASQPMTIVLTYPQGEPARATSDPGIAEMIAKERPDRVKRLEVTVEPLDSLVRKRGFKSPDFLKVDTEGGELDVLVGAENTIREHLPILYIELHGANRPAKMARQQKVHLLLRSWGYVIEDLQGTNILGADQPFTHIFCRHSSLASYPLLN